MRTALSVVFTLWPPGPDERKTSIRRSLSSILMSTSSASGSTATVAAEVWMRPCVSVAGHALDAVHAGLPAQQAEGLGSAHGDDRLLDAAEGAVAQRHRLPTEAVTLGEALVHAVEVGGEQRRLVAAGAGADLHDGVAIVVRIARDEQLVQLRLDRGDLRREAGQIGPGQRSKLGIRLVGELPSLFQFTLQPREPLGQADDRREPRVLPTEGLELCRIPGDRRVG